MKLTIFCVVGIFLVLFGTAQSQQEPVNRDESNVVTESEKKLWNVTAKLYKGVSNNTELDNFIFSPLSLTSSMVMLNEGAGRETAIQIRSLFQFGTNSNFSLHNQTRVIDSLKKQALDIESEFKLVTASRIYANRQHVNLSETYVTAVSSLGEVEPLDFTHPKPIVAEINEWFKNQTEGKISNIVNNKDFNRTSALVLLNMLYFKAPWKLQFNENDTKTAKFHVSENRKVQVEMMHVSAEFPYADLSEVEATAIFLPYKGDRISMIIYLPSSRRKLSTLDGKLETLVPSQVRNEATTSKISLHLPKFNISSSLDFKEILTSLGVQKMFGPEAYFRRMSKSAQFQISQVRQNVFIQVNEEGAEAAAVIDTDAILPAPHVIKVDRPFIFQIYDNETGTILLSGRISNPNESGKQRNVGDDDSGNSNWILNSDSSTFNIIMIIIGIITVIVFIVIVVGCILSYREYSDRHLIPNSRIKFSGI